MSANLRPTRAVPPGRIIERELDARGWTQKDLADIMDRPAKTINQIVRGQKQITPDTAHQLAEAFGTSPELWSNLETAYRLHLASLQQQDQEKIARRSRLYSLAPVAEITRRSWIKKTDSLEELEQEICEFLEIESTDQQPKVAANLRHAQVRGPELAAQQAWIQRVKHLAASQDLGTFDTNKLQQALPKLLSLSEHIQDLVQVPPLLLSLGCHFVIVPHLPQTYLDGAAFQLNEHPVVALTLRYNRIDSFWFTLLHELAHIIAKHDGVFLENLDEYVDSPVEAQANRMAQDWLIAPTQLQAFVRTTRPYFSRAKIIRFAESLGRHPGIVLGRLQRDKLVDYRNLRSLLVPVTPYLEPWVDVAVPNSTQERPVPVA